MLLVYKLSEPGSSSIVPKNVSENTGEKWYHWKNKLVILLDMSAHPLSLKDFLNHYMKPITYEMRQISASIKKAWPSLLEYKLQVSLRVLLQLITHSECSITAHIGGTNCTLHLILCLLLNGKETVNVQIVTFGGLTLCGPSIYQSTWSHIPQGLNRHQHCCQNYKFRTAFNLFIYSAHKFSKNPGTIEFLESEGSILRIHNSEVTCEPHCYLALSARCMWNYAHFLM
jgi:hypothetical protein